MSKRLHTLKLEIAHGSDRHEIPIYSDSPPTVGDLIKELEKKTRVPYSNIQIIFKGQRLHLQPEVALVKFGIFSGNKLQMIGERLSPSHDAIFRRILGIGKDVDLIVKALNESTQEFSLMESGGVDKVMAKEYLPQLHKRARQMKQDLQAFYNVLVEVEDSKNDLADDIRKHHANVKRHITENMSKSDSLIERISRLI
ncbi:unnamed protein product [Brachionus calyciflorus]|uniref:Ubiquitin-like domain-containing protein n=1 Tax=Brachionus calyciflorus TaxID=104777 RepID=A0A813WNE4_9BILA|nr:unnamed protein product [Brachionus calyciflorus]